MTRDPGDSDIPKDRDTAKYQDSADHRPVGDEVGEFETAEVEAPTTSAAAPTSAAGAPKEPLVSGDPLGFGGTSDPDAPSRRPKPKLLSLAGEFLRMSRTTMILLAAFMLVGALYLLVKDEPVVNLGPRQPAVPTEAETPPSSLPSETAESSETTAPTSPIEESTSPSGATATTAVPTQGNDDEVAESSARSPNRAPATSAAPGPTATEGAEPTGAGVVDDQPSGGTADGGASPNAQ